MYLNPNWRILTVGDGDLSFSAALAKQFPTATLTASVYDSETTLTQKYANNAVAQLKQRSVPIYFNFDVTNPLCWQQLNGQLFDVVIFQFPLLGGFSSAQGFVKETQAYSINTLHRALLYQYLAYAFHYALADNGLCYITSKDVKPYAHWGLEYALHPSLNLHYLGQKAFNTHAFKDYRVRNVQRDKTIKDTQGITYAWSKHAHHQLGEHWHKPAYLNADHHCPLCRAGAFMHQQDKAAHIKSKKHIKMQTYEQSWQQWLAQNPLKFVD